MRPMKTYDYDEIYSLLSDVKSVWIRSAKGEMKYYACGEECGLPAIRANNLEMCKKYSENNPNFAYEYNSSTDMITIWDKTIEEFYEISAPAFKEVDTCGMGIMAYEKYIAMLLILYWYNYNVL